MCILFDLQHVAFFLSFLDPLSTSAFKLEVFRQQFLLKLSLLNPLPILDAEGSCTKEPEGPCPTQYQLNDPHQGMKHGIAHKLRLSWMQILRQGPVEQKEGLTELQ